MLDIPFLFFRFITILEGISFSSTLFTIVLVRMSFSFGASSCFFSFPLFFTLDDFRARSYCFLRRDRGEASKIKSRFELDTSLDDGDTSRLHFIPSFEALVFPVLLLLCLDFEDGDKSVFSILLLIFCLLGEEVLDVDIFRGANCLGDKFLRCDWVEELKDVKVTVRCTFILSSIPVDDPFLIPCPWFFCMFPDLSADSNFVLSTRLWWLPISGLDGRRLLLFSSGFLERDVKVDIELLREGGILLRILFRWAHAAPKPRKFLVSELLEEAVRVRVGLRQRL
mmetsp:Transcript_4197/g.8103  ORF Transcript_4197/g.8103 Transcript_4197/m.8103 type:complete len:282 (+) Transcript_4197:602-1447(+)